MAANIYRTGLLGLLFVNLLFPLVSSAQTRSRYAAARAAMVNESVIGAGVTDQRVIEAMRATARHEFVPPPLRKQAYFDMALPIGNQQTISSPFIVAFMTQCLDPQPNDRVLEIGTGSGYQAAVLSPLVDRVYSIEILESLGLRAQRTLRRLSYDNVVTKVGDGFQGWPEHAPFDKIIVTCSPEEVPQPLVDQLKEGGLIVVPTGERYQQTLYLMRKEEGRLVAEALRPTLFVPMTGAAEEARQNLPDPARPRAINGDFEEPPEANGFLPGWYYQRQLTWETTTQAAGSNHFVTFRNREPGRAAHLLQGIAVDGRRVAELEVSARVRYRDLQFKLSSGAPMIAVTLYDENRRDLGLYPIGPFRGSSDWKSVSKRIRIPPVAREAILRIGLFGAVGEISFDDLNLAPRPR